MADVNGQSPQTAPPVASQIVPQVAPSVEAPGHADIVLGVFSHNSAATIAHAVRAGQESLLKYFPESRCVLVNVDGGSEDGTQALALEAAIDKESFLQTGYPLPLRAIESYGMPGKADAYRTIFGVAGKVGARACAVVDGSIASFTGDWVEALVRPVMEQQVDLVSPCYLRHKYEAPMLNGIVYPLTRALYGKRLRQPIGGDFALSGTLIDYLMAQPHSNGNAAIFGGDAWISTRACCGNFRLAQAALGPRILTRNDPAPDVSAMLADALGSIFAEMNDTVSVWQRIRGSETVPTFGSGCDIAADPDSEAALAELHSMIETFRLGYQNLQDIWRMVLSPASLVELKRKVALAENAFRFEDVLWARVIYDFALAYRMRIMDRNHLLRALTPIYLGWAASYILGVRDKGEKETQDRIEALCVAYETQKGYLISRWRWPDRFNP